MRGDAAVGFCQHFSVWCVRSIRQQICFVSLWPELNFILTDSVRIQFCQSFVRACVPLCVFITKTITLAVLSSCVKSVTAEGFFTL